MLRWLLHRAQAGGVLQPWLSFPARANPPYAMKYFHPLFIDISWHQRWRRHDSHAAEGAPDSASVKLSTKHQLQKPGMPYTAWHQARVQAHYAAEQQIVIVTRRLRVCKSGAWPRACWASHNCKLIGTAEQLQARLPSISNASTRSLCRTTCNTRMHGLHA